MSIKRDLVGGLRPGTPLKGGSIFSGPMLSLGKKTGEGDQRKFQSAMKRSAEREREFSRRGKGGGRWLRHERKEFFGGVKKKRAARRRKKKHMRKKRD